MEVREHGRADRNKWQGLFLCHTSFDMNNNHKDSDTKVLVSAILLVAYVTLIFGAFLYSNDEIRNVRIAITGK